MGLAVGLHSSVSFDRPALGRDPQTPPPRAIGTAGSVWSRATLADRQAMLPPCAASLVRHALAPGRIRHPHRPGTAGPPRRAHDDDWALSATSAAALLAVRRNRLAFCTCLLGARACIGGGPRGTRRRLRAHRTVRGCVLHCHRQSAVSSSHGTYWHDQRPPGLRASWRARRPFTAAALLVSAAARAAWRKLS